MFLWWSDPYTGMTIGLVLLTVALTLCFLFAGLRKRTLGKHIWTRRLSRSLMALWLLFFCPWLYITLQIGAASGVKQHVSEPALTLSLSDDRSLPLSELKGKVVLLDFWATWCAPCRASEPALNELTRRYGPDSLVLVRISGDENESKWRQYLVAHPSHAPEALDTEGRASALFEVTARPTFVLIDKSGTIRWKQTGWTPYSYLILRHQLSKLFS